MVMGEARFGNGIRGRIHPLDVLAACLTCRRKLFSRGWGDEKLLSHLIQNASFGQPLAPISVNWCVTGDHDGQIRRDGTFASPLDLLPTGARTAHVRAWSKDGNAAACVILAASRDEGYKTRERVFWSRAGSIYICSKIRSMAAGVPPHRHRWTRSVITYL